MSKQSYMNPDDEAIHHQIQCIRKAMQQAGVWSQEIPDWLDTITPHQLPDIWQWLQYIYLPMRLHKRWYKPHYIAPILSPYLHTTPELQHILKLVIELDSISPMYERDQEVDEKKPNT